MPSQNKFDKFRMSYNQTSKNNLDLNKPAKPSQYVSQQSYTPHQNKNNYEPTLGYQTQKNSTKKNLILGINVLSVVLLGVSGFLSYQLFNPNNSSGASIVMGETDTQEDAVAVSMIEVPKPESISLNTAFFGDVFWGRRMHTWSQNSELKEAFPFSGLNTFNRDQYDAWIANLECPITDENLTDYQQEVLLKFNCRPEYLKEASKYFDVFSLANNHTNNMEEFDGLVRTRQNLKNHGIQYFGHFDNSRTGDICEIINLPTRAIYSTSDLSKANQLKKQEADSKINSVETKPKNNPQDSLETETLEMEPVVVAQTRQGSSELSLDVRNDFQNEVQGLSPQITQTEENMTSEPAELEEIQNEEIESDIQLTEEEQKETSQSETEYIFSNPEDFISDYKIPVAMCGYHNVFRLPTEEEMQEINKYSQHFITIVMPHQGAEYTTASDALQRQYFRRMIDLGADFVIGGHTHSMNEVEAYNGKLIAYSLGNFIFDQQANWEVTTSYGINLNFNFEYNENILELQSLVQECLISDKDCLEIAKERNLARPDFNVDYDIIGSQNSNQITQKAESERMQFILQRTNWDNVKGQLQTIFKSSQNLDADLASEKD